MLQRCSFLSLPKRHRNVIERLPNLIVKRSGLERPQGVAELSRPWRKSSKPPMNNQSRNPFILFRLRPLSLMALKIAFDGDVDRGEEVMFADPLEKSKSLEFVLHRIFKLREAQLNSDFTQATT